MNEPREQPRGAGEQGSDAKVKGSSGQHSDATANDTTALGVFFAAGCILVAVLNALIPRMARSFDSVALGGFFFGMVLAELAVLSVWAVFAPLRLAVRWPLALLAGAILFGFAFMGMSPSGSDSAPRVIALLPLVMLAAQAPFWTVKLLGRVRVLGDLSSPETDRPLTTQDLLLGTVLIAVALGLTRFGLAGESPEAWSGVVLMLGLVAAVNLLFLPTLYFCLTSLPARTGALGVLLYAGLLSAGVMLAVVLFGAVPRLDGMISLVLGFCAGTVALTTSGLLALRAGGFRLGRSRRSATRV